MMRPPPRSTLFPYTTLFRSQDCHEFPAPFAGNSLAVLSISDRQGTDKTAMDFRRPLPEIRWQPCLSPVSACPPHPPSQSLAECPPLHVRRTAVPRIRGRRLREHVPLPFPASQSLGMESVPLLRAARAVHVRAAPAILERARHPPAAARVAGSGIPRHRFAGRLSGAGHPVLFRAPLYQEPAMGAGRGAGLQLPFSFLWALPRGGEGPRHRATAVANPGPRQVRRGTAQYRPHLAAHGAARRVPGGQTPRYPANSAGGGEAGIVR